jgi:diaminohydroxyphosphoribosylaminopyrimidine deaminase/5-amino-6-(5-phosphoribosylamino)uracil reductase
MEMFMKRALELAAQGMGKVAPNPLVGCVIVYEDRIIGEGFHQRYGGAHAEVNAINSVEDKSLIEKSTLYVTLEPCNHQGLTPACTELIIANKISKVVVATVDPNPLVSGKGIERLQEAGIQVELGSLEEQARWMNRRFNTFHEKQRPYIILKWAETQDGFMDILRENGETGSFAISGKEAKTMVHRWRTEEAAILVGSRTVFIDNPQLTARHWEGKDPVRIVIDANLKVPRTHRIFEDRGRTIVFNRLETRPIFNIEYVQLNFAEEILPRIMDYLRYEKLTSVIVEGGAATLGRFLELGLWDEIRRFKAPMKLEAGLKAPIIVGSPAETLKVGEDVLEVYHKNIE